MMARLIPSDKQTNWNLYCIDCDEQRPDGTPREDWGSFCVCLTPFGVQVWCRRCDQNLSHFDFGDHEVFVNMQTRPTFGTRFSALVMTQRMRDDGRGVSSWPSALKK
jgi:hypothetical protein